MKRKRRVRRILREKYDLSPDGAHFKWFPDQKVKPCGDFGIISTPPSSNKEIEEVISVIKSFRPKHFPSQDVVKGLFRKSGWEIDYKFFPEEGLWNFDAYKNGVAVEVLGKHIDEVYKDCFKFLLAYRAKETEIGVIVVPRQTKPSERPDAISVDAILHRLSPVLQDYGLWIFRASYSMDS
jgi:hypothetical protein